MNRISNSQYQVESISYTEFATQKRNQLFFLFHPFALGLIVYVLLKANNESSLDNIGAALITLSALLPAYLWCSGQAKGIPIFPILILQYIWTYAFPIITNHYRVIEYSVQEIYSASITTSIFILLMTFIWFQHVKTAPMPSLSYRGFSTRKRSYDILLLCLFISVCFNIGVTGQWIRLEAGIFSVIRIAIIAITSLAAFVLSHQLGLRQLTKTQGRLLILLIILFVITNTVSLLLVGSASVFFVAITGFVIGRKAIPLLPIIIMVGLLTFLHAGKGEMRSKYWFEQSYPALQLWEYPAFFQEWSDYSLKSFAPADEFTKPKDEESFFERSSMLQMLLLVQSKTPEQVPYLNGQTYALIPQLLIPRILNPQKIGVHAGTHMLSIHYGLQRPEKITNTIAWGLLPESYANFGVLGCFGLAIVLGMLYGRVARWTIGAPILSIQAFLSIVLLSVGLQSEASAGVFISTLYQSSIILYLINIVLMRNHWLGPSIDTAQINNF